jgi:hypothetical protein
MDSKLIKEADRDWKRRTKKYEFSQWTLFRQWFLIYAVASFVRKAKRTFFFLTPIEVLKTCADVVLWNRRYKTFQEMCELALTRVREEDDEACRQAIGE